MAIERVLTGFIILLTILLCISFGNSIYTWVNNHRLFRYLKRNNYKKWGDLTTIGQFGPGANNPFKIFPYIYGEQDNEDEKILRLKDAIRGGLCYVVMHLGAIIVTIMMMILFIKRYGKIE